MYIYIYMRRYVHMVLTAREWFSNRLRIQFPSTFPVWLPSIIYSNLYNLERPHKTPKIASNAKGSNKAPRIFLDTSMLCLMIATVRGHLCIWKSSTCKHKKAPLRRQARWGMTSRWPNGQDLMVILPPEGYNWGLIFLGDCIKKWVNLRDTSC